MYNINRYFIRKNNLKSKLYISKKLDSTEDECGNEIDNYDEPIKYYFNVKPVTTSSEIQAFGELANSMKVAVITEKDKYLNKFKEFDLAYLDGITPDKEPKPGFNANYRIYAVQPQNAIIKVYFIKLVKNN